MRILLSLITILTCLGNLPAQSNQDADAELAKALIAESALKVDEALTHYNSSISKAENASTTFWKASIGRTRCLTKLKRWQEARIDLDKFTKMKVPEEFQKELTALHEKLSASSPDALEEKVRDALRHGDMNSILELGEQARPVILRILQNPGRTDTSKAIRILFDLGGKDLQAQIHRLVEQKNKAESAIFNLLSGRLGQIGYAREWEQTIRLGTRSKDPKIRKSVVASMRFLPELGGDDLLRLIQDNSHLVRRAARLFVYNNYQQLSPVNLARVFQAVAQDPLPSGRSWVLQNISLLDGVNRSLADSLVNRMMLEEKNGDLRSRAYHLSATRDSRAKAYEILMAGLKDPSPQVITTCLRQLGGIVGPNDIPAVLPFLEHFDHEITRASQRALERFTAEQLVAADTNETILGRLAAKGRSEFGIAKLAIAGSKKHRDSFLRLLFSNSTGKRCSAIYYFIRHDDVAAIPSMMSVWRNLSSRTIPSSKADQSAGVPNLVNFGHPQLIQFLIKHKRANELGQMFGLMDFLRLNQYDGFERLLKGMTEVRAQWDQTFILESLASSKNTSRKTKSLEHFLPDLQESDELQALLFELLRLHGGRSFAAKRLTEWKDGLDLQRLLGIYQQSQSKDVARLLKARMTPELAQTITDKVAQESESNLGGLCVLLEVVPIEGAIERLFERLKSERITNQNLHRWSISLFAKAKQEEAIPMLLAHLKEDRVTLASKFTALRAGGPSKLRDQLILIHKMGDDVFWPVCEQILADAAWPPRVKADVLHLAVFTKSEKVEALVKNALSSPDSEIRSRAAYAAGHLMMLDTIPILKDLLRDSASAMAADASLKRFAELGVDITK